MYPQGVCRIRKPAYAGNGCAIFLVFQTEEVGQKDGCGSQTQLRGVALKDKGPSTEIFRASMPRSCRLFYFVLTKNRLRLALYIQYGCAIMAVFQKKEQRYG